MVWIGDGCEEVCAPVRTADVFWRAGPDGTDEAGIFGPRDGIIDLLDLDDRVPVVTEVAEIVDGLGADIFKQVRQVGFAGREGAVVEAIRIGHAPARAARSAALFVRQMQPSFRNSVKAVQRLYFSVVTSSIALATSLCFDNLVRASTSQSRRPSTSGRARCCRTARRASAPVPLMSRSMSKIASICFSAAGAMGEMSCAGLPPRTLPAMSAISKNFRRAWLQHLSRYHQARKTALGEGLRRSHSAIDHSIAQCARAARPASDAQAK